MRRREFSAARRHDGCFITLWVWFFRLPPHEVGAAKEAIMDEDIFNGSIRKFLKTLGVSAQREIEKAVRQALAEGKLKGNERFPATGTITLAGIGLSHEVKGEIELE